MYELYDVSKTNFGNNLEYLYSEISHFDIENLEVHLKSGKILYVSSKDKFNEIVQGKSKYDLEKVNINFNIEAYIDDKLSIIQKDLENVYTKKLNDIQIDVKSISSKLESKLLLELSKINDIKEELYLTKYKLEDFVKEFESLDLRTLRKLVKRLNDLVI